MRYSDILIVGFGGAGIIIIDHYLRCGGKCDTFVLSTDKQALSVSRAKIKHILFEDKRQGFDTYIMSCVSEDDIKKEFRNFDIFNNYKRIIIVAGLGGHVGRLCIQHYAKSIIEKMSAGNCKCFLIKPPKIEGVMRNKNAVEILDKLKSSETEHIIIKLQNEGFASAVECLKSLDVKAALEISAAISEWMSEEHV